ncbi:hypothetical protein OIU76_004662 [Salix suchowensis]|nr:hypothetical protein OIU76_004662 [Salix suchowensis]
MVSKGKDVFGSKDISDERLILSATKVIMFLNLSGTSPFTPHPIRQFKNATPIREVPWRLKHPGGEEVSELVGGNFSGMILFTKSRPGICLVNFRAELYTTPENGGLHAELAQRLKAPPSPKCEQPPVKDVWRVTRIAMPSILDVNGRVQTV